MQLCCNVVTPGAVYKILLSQSFNTECQGTNFVSDFLVIFFISFTNWKIVIVCLHTNIYIVNGRYILGSFLLVENIIQRNQFLEQMVRKQFLGGRDMVGHIQGHFYFMVNHKYIHSFFFPFLSKLEAHILQLNYQLV